MATNIPSGSLASIVASTIPTDIPLQEQIDTFVARGAKYVSEEMARQVDSHIEHLAASGVAEFALKEDEQAPDFTLPDALGQAVTLSQLLTQGPVVIIFYRGEWCPYCNLELRAYQKALPQLQELGATLVAISPQTPDHSLSTQEKHELGFVVLSDRGNRVARAYGLAFELDEAGKALHAQLGADLPAYNGDDSWELLVPGTFLIDQARAVRLASVDSNFFHRLDPSFVIARLKELK
ncbi:peroxiredoxin-like family protein [Ktedonobacter robiniae]|uniref:thioredoxin-dependent peroxiredoxin n=1 Tax=Ktedonobacter robiniae TaxID=2778365 RepID=A0ABQ3UGK7_9CHLR|nr:peroxiredoxin-like family protein [Ktedonobacter robiniae]GHO51840.1 alkyl hydroperoxide reductase [Ktedonobacter robiniae]